MIFENVVTTGLGRVCILLSVLILAHIELNSYFLAVLINIGLGIRVEFILTVRGLFNSDAFPLLLELPLVLLIVKIHMLGVNVLLQGLLVFVLSIATRNRAAKHVYVLIILFVLKH